MNVTLERVWDEYRGWAKRARSLQASTTRWNTAALACAVLAALFGAAATQAAGSPYGGRVLSFLAAVAAAVVPILGRDILAVGREGGWIRARATGEALKSECLLFAAGVGPYAGRDEAAAEAFDTRCDAITVEATRAGLTPLPDPVSDKGDPRRPVLPLTAEWYRTNRLRDQITFYADRQGRLERAVNVLRTVSFGSAIVAAVLGVAGSAFGQERFAPWIGAMMTATASVAAYGLMERRQYLAASYGALVSRLNRIEGRLGSGEVARLVATTESVLQGEHAAWTDRMTQTIPVPPAASGGDAGPAKKS